MREIDTQEAVAEYLGVTVRSLQEGRRRGDGPPWFRVGNAPRYRRRDVEAWIEQSVRPAREAVRG